MLVVVVDVDVVVLLVLREVVVVTLPVPPFTQYLDFRYQSFTLVISC